MAASTVLSIPLVSAVDDSILAIPNLGNRLYNGIKYSFGSTGNVSLPGPFNVLSAHKMQCIAASVGRLDTFFNKSLSTANKSTIASRWIRCENLASPRSAHGSSSDAALLLLFLLPAELLCSIST